MDTGTGRARLQLLIAVVVGALLIQAIRPWGDGASGPGPSVLGSGSAVASIATASTPPLAPATRSADPDVASTARLRMTCGSTDSWRATNLQVWPDRAIPIRSWIAIEPISVGDPLDAAIPFAPVAADEVTAIGFCAPLDEALRPPVSVHAALWRLADDGAVPLALVPADPTDLDTLRGLWLPPAGVGVTRADGSGSAWPPGRYVIGLATPGGSYARMLGIEILDLGDLRSPAPSSPGSQPGTATPGGDPSPGP